MAVKPKSKAKQALVVYIEPGRIEYVQLAYAKGEKGLDNAKTVVIGLDETVESAIKRLGIGSGSRKDTDLILFLSKAYYQRQGGFYPESLEDELEKIMEYSMAENLFYDHEKQRWFFGARAIAHGTVRAPMFSAGKEFIDKLQEAFGADAFKNFIIAPDSLGMRPLLALLGNGPDSSATAEGAPNYACVGRLAGNGKLALHRFSEGALMDSTEVAIGGEALKMLAWTILGLGPAVGPQEVHLFFSPDEKGFKLGNIPMPVQVHSLTKPFVHYLALSLLELEALPGFLSTLKLKKWRVPLAAWGIALCLAAYAGFAYYQSLDLDGLRHDSAQAAKVLNGLKQQWNPVDERRKSVEELEQQASDLMKSDVPRVDAMKLLTLLTETTPTDTWLKQIYLKGETLTLTGESGDALQYRTILSNMDEFDDVKFASTVHHIPSENIDRFTLKARVVPENFK